MPVKKTTKKATPKPKKAPEAVAAAVDTDDEPKTGVQKDAVNILDRNGAFAGVYSLALMGENYRELAQQYATKIGGKVVELK